MRKPPNNSRFTGSFIEIAPPLTWLVTQFVVKRFYLEVYTILKIVTSPFAAISIEIRVIKSASNLIIFHPNSKIFVSCGTKPDFFRRIIYIQVLKIVLCGCVKTQKILNELKFSKGPNRLYPFEGTFKWYFCRSPTLWWKCLPNIFIPQTTKYIFTLFCITFNPTIQ